MSFVDYYNSIGKRLTNKLVSDSCFCRLNRTILVVELYVPVKFVPTADKHEQHAPASYAILWSP
jgi:hypothetical protein